MIDWIDCIVPASDMRTYVWVAYQRKSPYLPVAVADTARELGEILGVPEINIRSVASKHNKGKIKQAQYMRVYTGILEEV